MVWDRLLFNFSYSMNLSIQVQKYFLTTRSWWNLSALSKSILAICYGTGFILLGIFETLDLFDLDLDLFEWPSVVVYVIAAVFIKSELKIEPLPLLVLFTFMLERSEPLLPPINCLMLLWTLLDPFIDVEFWGLILCYPLWFLAPFELILLFDFLSLLLLVSYFELFGILLVFEKLLLLVVCYDWYYYCCCDF